MSSTPQAMFDHMKLCNRVAAILLLGARTTSFKDSGKSLLIVNAAWVHTTHLPRCCVTHHMGVKPVSVNMLMKQNAKQLPIMRT